MQSLARRYGQVYQMMVRNSLIREMNFKLNFLLWLVVESLWFVGQLIFVQVIYGQVSAIADWTKWQMVLLIGTHQIISQIFQGFFYTNLTNLPELVRTGKLDFFLLQPIDAQFIVSLRRFGLDSLVNTLIGMVIVIYSLFQLRIVPSVGQILLYGAAILIGVTIHYAIMFGLAATSFWTVRSQGLIWGYFNVMTLARYPDGIFKGLTKFILSWFLPVLVVSNVPARILMNAAERPWPLIGHLILASVLMLLISRVLWKSALNHYSSASS